MASEDSLTLPAKPVAGPKRYRDPYEAPVRKLTVNLLATYKEINAVRVVALFVLVVYARWNHSAATCAADA